ncbi:PREDICTED: VIP peptides-like, partial [Myotis brandtii]|uniref:VIP peptides-like n=1 Tax=Myotis brandtii TaxID=109478 RepID=UPI000704281C
TDISEDQGPIRRHSDAVFTDNYTRLRKVIAVKKHLNNLLGNPSVDGAEMETKKNSQLLVLMILLSVLFSQTLAVPPLEAEALRNVRHADGVSTSDISSLLDPYSPKEYPESLIEKRASTDISEDQGPNKRHTDTILTEELSRLLKQPAVKEYLKGVLERTR